MRVFAGSEVEMAIMSISPGAVPVMSRHACMDSIGNPTSSFRRLSLSSLTANTSRPSFKRAAPASWQQSRPRPLNPSSAATRWHLRYQSWRVPSCHRLQQVRESASRIPAGTCRRRCRSGHPGSGRRFRREPGRRGYRVIFPLFSPFIPCFFREPFLTVLWP